MDLGVSLVFLSEMQRILPSKMDTAWESKDVRKELCSQDIFFWEKIFFILFRATF